LAADFIVSIFSCAVASRGSEHSYSGCCRHKLEQQFEALRYGVRRPVVRVAGGPAAAWPRIAALERELEELHRVEERRWSPPRFAARESVYRSPSAPPAVVLGVWVADKVSRAA
jgi:hypothetical protein